MPHLVDDSPPHRWNLHMNEPGADFLRHMRRRTGNPSSFLVLPTLVLIIASLYWAQTILIPIALSILLTFLLSPVVGGLERLGLRRVPSVIFIVVLTFSLLATLGWITTLQFTSLAKELPKYQGNIKQKIADVRAAGKGGNLEQVQKTVEEIKGEIQKDEEPAKGKGTPRPVVVEGEQSSTFWPVPLVIGPVVERLASAGLAIVLVIFMLIRREDLRDRLIRLVGYSCMVVTTKALEDAGERISRYLLMQSIINSLFGLAVGVALFLIGLPYAIFWGLLAAVLRFVPYAGPWIAALMPTALGLAAFEGWIWPVFIIGLFGVLELFANMVLEPLLYSDSAGVSEVALLVAVAFWAWLWGPIGLVMATPLTVCLVVIGKYVPQMEFIRVLMSDDPVAESNVIYYQRLLATNQDAAAQVVEEYLKTNPQEQVYDEVLVPALNFARLDRERGSLTDADEQFIFQATRAIVENINSNQRASALETDGSGIAIEESLLLRPRVRILGCPARDGADEVALLMLQQLLHSTRYDLELIAEEKLASEVVAEVAEKKTGLVCIAAVQPGGLDQARYLCKRLRSQFPDVKIAVGLWGFQDNLEDNRNSLLSAGADEVSTNLVETRDQIANLGQRVSNLNTAPDGLTAKSLAT
jgi:predicted PurR-regulated permease PerM